MDRKLLESMKLDRRLIRRRNWIHPDELKREIDALPDVAHKVAPVAEEEPTADAPDTESPASD